jgi:hypothetical protein
VGRSVVTVVHARRPARVCRRTVRQRIRTRAGWGSEAGSGPRRRGWGSRRHPRRAWPANPVRIAIADSLAAAAFSSVSDGRAPRCTSEVAGRPRRHRGRGAQRPESCTPPTANSFGYAARRSDASPAARSWRRAPAWSGEGDLKQAAASFHTADQASCGSPRHPNVIFDSTAPIGQGQAVYLDAHASMVAGDELPQRCAEASHGLAQAPSGSSRATSAATRSCGSTALTRAAMRYTSQDGTRPTASESTPAVGPRSRHRINTNRKLSTLGRAGCQRALARSDEWS